MGESKNMSFIEVNINNSFNKKDNHHKNEDKFLNNLTMSSYKDIRETSSVALSSLTNSQLYGQNIITKIGGKTKESFIRGILIGSVSGLIGGVLSTIIVYFILGIK